jgi:chemotaxis protein MotB
MDDKATIIIKRGKNKKHAEHHGGSWKVAYADFVTAMMAFFLLMWLITMVSPEKKLAVSEYFKEQNVLQGQSTSSSKSIMDKSPSPLGVAPPVGKAGATDLIAKVKKSVEQKLQSYKNHVVIDIVEGGVRIQLIDMEGSQMFPAGSVELTPRGKEIIQLVAENIKDLPNRIAIEGHTDAARFAAKGAHDTNWELSTARASSARRELENNGIDPNNIARVVGYADQELFIKENPNDPRNRRISIIVLQPRQQVMQQMR